MRCTTEKVYNFYSSWLIYLIFSTIVDIALIFIFICRKNWNYEWCESLTFWLNWTDRLLICFSLSKYSGICQAYMVGYILHRSKIPSDGELGKKKFGLPNIGLPLAPFHYSHSTAIIILENYNGIVFSSFICSCLNSFV